MADRPLTSVRVTTTAAALAEKLAAARRGLSVDCAFWGGLVPENADELEPLLDAGVVGVKAFLIDSGIDEFRSVGERELERAMPALARRGVPLLAHAELATCACGPASDSPAQYRT